MLQQVLSLSLLAAMAVPPASSQGIARNSCVSCTSVISAPATKVLVATPFPSVYPSAPADSTNAVLLGNGMRDKLARTIDGGEWQVITRLQMNSSLVQWGYSADALLPPDLARTVEGQLSARVLVTTALSKGADGRYVANTRFSGLTDGAGHMLKSTQAPGQQLADMGGKIADQIAILFKAYNDAKACNDAETAAPAKAIESANKALKTVPGFGVAEYCLGEIARAKDSASSDALQHFKNAVTADPMSLKAVGQVAAIDMIKRDSAGVVADYQQMITIAPTNTPLANDAIKVFRQYGHPEAAEQVVEQQSKLDPTNPDWPDLKGNSCAAQGAGDTIPAEQKVKYQCAFDAFSHEYELDPARADTTFFQKIVFVAQTRADSMTWAKQYVKKYPNNTDPLNLEMQLYAGAGQVDSALTIVRLLTRIDPTDSKPTLIMSKALIDAKNPDAAVQFVDYFKKNGDENGRNTYAGLLINALQAMANQTPRPDSDLIVLGQAVVDVAPTSPNFMIYGNYFMSIGLADQLGVVSTALRQNKTCDAAKAEDTLLNRLEPALNIAATSPTAGISDFAKQFLAKLPPEKQFVSDMMTKELKCP